MPPKKNVTIKNLLRTLEGLSTLSRQMEPLHRLDSKTIKANRVNVDNAFAMSLAITKELNELRVRYIHDIEIQKALELMVDRHIDLRTVFGSEGKNLALLLAQDKDNLHNFLPYLLKQGSAFYKVLTEISESDFVKVKRIIELAEEER